VSEVYELAQNWGEIESKYEANSHLILDDALKLIADPRPEPDDDEDEDEPEDEPEPERTVLLTGADYEPEPEPVDQAAQTYESWQVEAVSMDGKIWRSGARFGTRDEAEIYLDRYARHEVKGFAAAAVLECHEGNRPRQAIREVGLVERLSILSMALAVCSIGTRGPSPHPPRLSRP
jgi:hypothetical protein